MTAAISQLRTDHRNFSRLLEILDRQLDLVADPQLNADFPLMRDVMRYMTHYPDKFHHPKEDLIFAALVVREPDVRGVVGKLREGHRGLARKGLNLFTTLSKVVDGAMVERDELLSSGREYLLAQRSHIDLEEDDVFHRADARLREEDWVLIEREIGDMADPLFGEIAHSDFLDLLDYIMREAPGRH